MRTKFDEVEKTQLAEAIANELLAKAQATGKYAAFTEQVRAQLSALPEDQRGPWFSGGEVRAEHVENAFRSSMSTTIHQILDTIHRLGFAIVRTEGAKPSQPH